MEVTVDREFSVTRDYEVKVSLVFSNGCRISRYEPARNHHHAIERMHAMKAESLLDTIARVYRHA